jgi:hypothetical protein
LDYPKSGLDIAEVDTWTSISTVVEKQYRVVISDFTSWPGHPGNTSQAVASQTKTDLQTIVTDYDNSHPSLSQINVTVVVPQPINVVWGGPGGPQDTINTQLAAGAVDFWLALGEHDTIPHNGQFNIETVASNERDPGFRDEYGHTGIGVNGLVSPVGLPESTNAAIQAFVGDARAPTYLDDPSMPYLPLARGIKTAQISKNAGTDQCNEMAYYLYIQLLAKNPKLKAAAFVHVPGAVPPVNKTVQAQILAAAQTDLQNGLIAADLASRVFSALLVEKAQNM